MAERPNPIQLVGYLEEALPIEEMARVEEHLRNDPSWRTALQELTQEIGAGDHSLAAVWRRNRLTCPSRERLGAFLADGLGEAESQYVRFHLDVIQCRWCMANLRDLQEGAAAPEKAQPAAQRRRKFFETSIGFLPKAR